MSHRIGSNRSNVKVQIVAPTKTAATPAPATATKTAPASSSFQAAGAQKVVLNPQPQLQNSAVRFDASNPEIAAYAHSRGWDRAGLKTTVTSADLVYTTDGWKTTKTAPLQFLMNGQQGFVLRDVPEGTNVEYAVHAHVGVSHDGFYSLDDRGELWANNGGANYRGSTGNVIGS